MAAVPAMGIYECGSGRAGGAADGHVLVAAVYGRYYPVLGARLPAGLQCGHLGLRSAAGESRFHSDTFEAR